MNDCDVIVIGGGPSGSTVAWNLANKGRSVILLERDKFPRFHIGESLLPYSTPLFAEMGLTDKIASAGFMLKRGAQFETGYHPRSVKFRFAEGRWTEYPTSWQVERSRFDKILLDHAAEAGADIREECRVTNYQTGQDGASVEYQDPSGETQTLKARFLVDASGMTAFTGVKEGVRTLYKDHRKVAMFGHFRGVKMPAGDRAGDIVLIRLKRGWCWLIPLTPETTSVGFVMSAFALKNARADQDAFFDSMLTDSPAVAERMKSAEKIGPMHIIRDFSYMNDRFVSPGLIRVGDAAGFLDPVFSSGVFLAMYSGRLAAQALDEALEKNLCYVKSMGSYEKIMKRIMKSFWRMIKLYYTHRFTEVFVNPQSNFGLVSAINALLAGRVPTPWKITWRLGIFYAVVRLQHWFPLLPRLRGVSYEATDS